jgi:hypothetical protein
MANNRVLPRSGSPCVAGPSRPQNRRERGSQHEIPSYPPGLNPLATPYRPLFSKGSYFTPTILSDSEGRTGSVSPSKRKPLDENFEESNNSVSPSKRKRGGGNDAMPSRAVHPPAPPDITSSLDYLLSASTPLQPDLRAVKTAAASLESSLDLNEIPQSH